MSLDKDTIEKRIVILDEDLVKVKQNLQNLSAGPHSFEYTT